jgi:hypothetical protein
MLFLARIMHCQGAMLAAKTTDVIHPPNLSITEGTQRRRRKSRVMEFVQGWRNARPIHHHIYTMSGWLMLMIDRRRTGKSNSIS